MEHLRLKVLSLDFACPTVKCFVERFIVSMYTYVKSMILNYESKIYILYAHIGFRRCPVGDLCTAYEVEETREEENGNVNNNKVSTLN